LSSQAVPFIPNSLYGKAALFQIARAMRFSVQYTF